jgi:hypothetical protein
MTATIPRPHPKVVFRELSDGGVILHLETGQYHSLNATASAIFKLVDGDRSPHEIASAFRDLLDDPPEDIDAVVARLLNDLRVRDLIEG